MGEGRRKGKAVSRTRAVWGNWILKTNGTQGLQGDSVGFGPCTGKRFPQSGGLCSTESLLPVCPVAMLECVVQNQRIKKGGKSFTFQPLLNMERDFLRVSEYFTYRAV